MTAKDWRFAVADVAQKLPDDPAVFRFHYALRHGTLKLGLYAPRGHDAQGPHKLDELYIVASGTGTFVKNGERQPFGPLDALFVEAGAEHRFEDFSDDFAVWVVFYGPDGGEKPAGD
jgi:mannose-6-phosphate isomerase-like protein (cupin superfamily)